MIAFPIEARLAEEGAELIRVRGLVQGVGFRPTVWRLARRHGLRGWVANDGDGVCIHVCGTASAIDGLVHALKSDPPPLARIDRIEREPATLLPQDDDFHIVASMATRVHTGVVPDAATCAECLAEIFDPLARRYRYPFTNCTHCGPRLAIVEAIPYDRAATTMRAFPLCAACRAEYDDPADRRFHAQPLACPACGPRAWLAGTDGAPIALEELSALDDAVDAACTLLQRGHIVAIKGLGGFQLACDASDEVVVSRLRELKRRERKPFALMARDLDVIGRYCAFGDAEAALLGSPAAPIVILNSRGSDRLAASVAPGVKTLGFMLPNTPLHHLLLRRMDRPIVLTSGNLSDEPQCIANHEALARLGGIAEYFLMHDRDVARRVDDSVVRAIGDVVADVAADVAAGVTLATAADFNADVAAKHTPGAAQILRRARGYAPATMPLPEGFAATAPLLAMGGELKNTFCLTRDGHAIVSHHMGDLEDALTHADYRSSLERYLQLFEHEPQRVAVDLHPEYLSGKLGRELARRRAIALVGVQHHHAHIASCMAENSIALDATAVFGIALDGLGYGSDGALWGGEFLLADYRQCERLATFKPVSMPGGAQAIREPWRNTYAHLRSAIGWDQFAKNHARLDLFAFLEARPRGLLDTMIERGVNSPLASSCGRLFDAVAGAAGVCRERALYEGQAAIEFEALVDARAAIAEDDRYAYPFEIARLEASGLRCIEPRPMWRALLDDLMQDTPTGRIAARFHQGLAIAVVRMVEVLARETTRKAGGKAPNTVALSGGVFQNRVLLEQVSARLARGGFHVLMHHQVPANDGGLALGQAAVAAARSLPA